MAKNLAVFFIVGAFLSVPAMGDVVDIAVVCRGTAPEGMVAWMEAQSQSTGLFRLLKRDFQDAGAEPDPAKGEDMGRFAAATGAHAVLALSFAREDPYSLVTAGLYDARRSEFSGIESSLGSEADARARGEVLVRRLLEGWNSEGKPSGSVRDVSGKARTLSLSAGSLPPFATAAACVMGSTPLEGISWRALVGYSGFYPYAVSVSGGVSWWFGSGKMGDGFQLSLGVGGWVSPGLVGLAEVLAFGYSFDFGSWFLMPEAGVGIAEYGSGLWPVLFIGATAGL